MINNFGNGASYLLEGFRLLKQPRILPFVIIPLLLNIALFYFSISYLYANFDLWLNGFLDQIPDWLSFIKWLLWPLFIGMILLIVAYGFTFVATLIGSPFYGLLAEQTEKVITGESADSVGGLLAVLALIPRTLMREIQKLLHYFLWLIPLLILSLLSLLIPLLAPLMPFIWFVFGAWMLAIQYTDYSYDNHQIPFKILRKNLKSDRATALGLGAAAMFSTMIPLLNIIAIPAAVCGGTAFYVERLKKESKHYKQDKKLDETNP
jgi:CysZ protein